MLIIFKSLLRSFEDLVGSLTIEEIKVSSAKSLGLDFKPSAKSLILFKKKSGLRIKPCGTPTLMPCQSEHWPFKTTRQSFFVFRLNRHLILCQKLLTLQERLLEPQANH